MKLAVSPGQAQRHLGWRRRREDSATVGENDPVTSLPLGLIKGCVGGSDQRIAPGDMERHGRNADRCGDLVQRRAIGDCDFHGTNRFKHCERARLRHVHAGARQQHQEFLAAETADDVGLADGFQQDLAEFTQDGVARLVAIGVIDPLEVIDVENGHSHRLYSPVS